MMLEVRAVAPFYKNGFVVACEKTREAIIIDPGDEVDDLVGLVRDLKVAKIRKAEQVEEVAA